MQHHCPQKVTVFHRRATPEEGALVGYALLIDFIYKKTKKLVPLPEQLAICTQKHRRYNTKHWQVFTKRHQPDHKLTEHLVFALKYEGLDLYILKSFFEYIKEGPVVKMVKDEPSGKYSRIIWFLYEWLMGTKIELPDSKSGRYAEVLNPKLQYPGPSINSTRHRVKNNLPGTPEFCPLIRKTKKLQVFISKDLSAAIEDGLKDQDIELVKRTAAFLLLKDSKASFAIEGENPPDQRARNWGRAIGQAGEKVLTIKEIERLQDIVIGPKKLKNMGIRKGEGFIGEHDRDTFSPIPDHISARAKDLSSLLNGVIEANNLLQKSAMDPVLVAAVIAFGFLYIHPLADGNGRIHRYLIHHILLRSGYTQRDMIFPISSAILNRIGEYLNVLQAYARPILTLIEWKETADHNVEILNETADLYRYFDLTKQTEFLFECVENTIFKIIPDELEYLRKHDELSRLIKRFATLPPNRVDLLIKLLRQNKGKLSKKKRQKEFSELSDMEVGEIEKVFEDVF